MTLKKSTNINNASHSSFTQFRTIIKSRINKQTVKEVVNLSASLQQSLENQDNVSAKSTNSFYKKASFDRSGTENLKNFVRKMKKTNQLNQKNTNTRPKISNINSVRQTNSVRSSVYSTRSNRSICQTHVVKQKVADIADNVSVVSSKSLSKSQFFSKSRLITSGKQEQAISSNQKLCRMQQKIDYLIKNKLKNLMLRTKSNQRFNPRSVLMTADAKKQMYQSLVQDSLLQKQIKSLMNQIKLLKAKDSQKQLSSEGLVQQVEQLDKKIQLFQKLIASSYTQSEILKKFYFSKKSQKYPHLNKRQKILEQINKRKQIIKNNHSLPIDKEIKSNSPIVKYESTSKYFHTKPSKKDYNTEHHRFNSFTINRQPLPRSVYGRQFLNYGTLPVFNYKPHDNSYTNSKLNIKTSNYQEAFKQKNIKMTQINYRDLDCFKNKIKFGNVTFTEIMKDNIKKSKNLNSKNSQKSQQTLNKQRISKQTVQNIINAKKMQELYKTKKQEKQIKLIGNTQMKRQFVWYDSLKKQKQMSQSIVDANSPGQTKQNSTLFYAKPSKIKDQKLNNLKASYTMEYLR